MKGKLLLGMTGMLIGCLAYGSWFALSLLRAVSVYRVVRTNAPAAVISSEYASLIPTNNWVTEVPFIPGSNSLVSTHDLQAIKRLGVMRGWWPARIERVVIDSDNEATIEYPNNATTYFHQLTVVKEDGKWRIHGERMRRLPDPSGDHSK